MATLAELKKILEDNRLTLTNTLADAEKARNSIEAALTELRRDYIQTTAVTVVLLTDYPGCPAGSVFTVDGDNIRHEASSTWFSLEYVDNHENEFNIEVA